MAKPTNLFEARTKIYTRRDSATTALKKLGIAAKDYDRFIEKAENNQFICHLDQAKEHLAFHAGQIPPKEKRPSKADLRPVRGPRKPKEEVVETPVKATKATKARKTAGAESLSSSIRRLIKEGLENVDIVDRLDLDPSRKHYPSWYRSQMRRSGEL